MSPANSFVPLTLCAMASCTLAPAQSFFQCDSEGCDGGVASTTDAGHDGGADAGPDAGADSGTDAGPDAGPDAGSPLPDAGTIGFDAGVDGGCGPNTILEPTPVGPPLCVPCGQRGQPCCADPHASCAGATYYIDCAGGNDSNNGHAKISDGGSAGPWQHHPYMANAHFDGGYTHDVGDRFIFKGGVVCPTQDFPMTIALGGIDAGYDYYGIDPTWYADASADGDGGWSPPVFDLQGRAVGGDGGLNDDILVLSVASSVTIDGLEMRGHAWAMNYVEGTYPNSTIANDARSSGSVTIENCYIHGWSHADAGDNYWAIAGPAVISRVLIDGSDGDGKSGTGIFNSQRVSKSTLQSMSAGVVSSVAAFGNTVSDLHDSYDPMFRNPFAIEADIAFDNLIFNLDPSVTALAPVYNAASGLPAWAWNNVVFGTFTPPIMMRNVGLCGGTNCQVPNSYFWNNTLVTSGSVACIQGGMGNLSTLFLENNQCVTNGSVLFEIYPTFTVAELVDAGNLPLSHTLDSGYSSADYAPLDAGAPTIGAGVNLSGFCDGGLAAPCTGPECLADLQFLCTDRPGKPRPSTGPWDVGAYQYR